jgi:hypothetical protein
MKPIVDGLERTLEGQATILKVDLLNPLGRKVAREYGVTLIPALLVFDCQGKVVLHQAGFIQPDAVRHVVTKLHHTRECDR